MTSPPPDAQLMTADRLLYPPSIFDKVFYWMSRQPSRRWVYLAVYAATVGLVLISTGIDGRTGTDRYAFVFVNALWSVIAYGSIDFIDTEVVRAADRFRAVFAGTDQEFDDEVYRLSTMPARTAIIVWGVSFATFSYLGLTQVAVADLQEPLARLVQWPFFAFSYSGGPLLVYHTVRLLAGVSRLLQAGNVNIFHLRPLYGFSRVTARVAFVYISLAVLNFISEMVIVIGGGLAAELWIGVFIALGLAIASFVAPLVGTHRRIMDAKSDAIQENSVHVEEIRLEMYQALERHDTERLRGLDYALDALLKMGNTIEGISAWPWSKGTFRGFATAIGAPLLIFIAQRILDPVL